MALRWRILTDAELRLAEYNGQPQFVRLHNHWRGGEQYAVLEESYGESSAEGESWRPVEVTG